MKETLTSNQIHLLSFCMCISCLWTHSIPGMSLGPHPSHAVLSLVAQSCPTLCNPMDCSPPSSSVHEDSPGKNTGVGGHALLQVIFPTQGLNLGLPHCKWILYHLSHQGNSRIQEWVANPSSQESSPPRSWTGISCIAGRFFTLAAELPGKPHPSHIHTKLSTCIEVKGPPHWTVRPQAQGFHLKCSPRGIVLEKWQGEWGLQILMEVLFRKDSRRKERIKFLHRPRP